MPALLKKPSLRAPVWLAIGMLLPACTNGTVPLVLLGAAGGGSGTSSEPQLGKAGMGNGGSGAGNSGGRGAALAGEPRAGAGAGSGAPWLPPTPCEGLWEPELEDALREAVNEALSDGRLCPRESTGLRRPLTPDADLTWQAHAAICFGPPGRGTWGRVPRTTTLGWVLSETPSLEDAKKALLDSDDRGVLCDEAQRTTFRAIGVGHGGDSWSVFISPAMSEDMRREDMQKP